jgi:putative transcriptional regulator
MEKSLRGNTESIRAGNLLIAEPFMGDPYFSRSVVLLCEHAPEGSLGFILNKPLDVILNDLLPEALPREMPVFYGGPVHTDTLHYLHNVGDLLEDSKEVGPGVYWGGSYEKLKFLMAQQLVLPDNIRFFVGYAGWSEGQLLEEMQYGSWVIGDLDANYVFRESTEDLWQSVMRHKGGTFSVLGEMGLHLSN